LRWSAWGSVPLVVVAAYACSDFEATDTAPASDGGDAGDAEDAGSDATPAADGSSDAPMAPFCEIDGGTICEDFDDPQSSRFPLPYTTDGGTITIVDDPHYSPPKALRATYSPIDAGGCNYAIIESATLGAPAPNGFHAEYKVRLAKLSGIANIGARIYMAAADGGRNCDYYVWVTPTGASLHVGNNQGDSDDHALGERPIVGQWSHLTIDVHGAAGAQKVEVTVDDKVALVDTAVRPECAFDTALRTVEVGLHCVDETVAGDLDIAVDDVRVIVR